MGRLLLRILLLMTGVPLFGCASNATQIQQRMSQMDAPFAFNGRVAIMHDGKKSSAGLRWVHGVNEDELLLLAPLGQTVARIHRDARGVTLDENGKHHLAQDVEALTQQVLGWELPLSGLRYWVVALPSVGSEANIQRDANGQMTVLRQDDWVIRYMRYATQATDSLPMRLVLQREHLEILVLVDEWEKQ